MKFVNESNVDNAKITHLTDKFKYTIIDNFFNETVINDILNSINNLSNDKANTKFFGGKHEHNKYTFTKNLGDLLTNVFEELATEHFCKKLENLFEINDLIYNERKLKGAGVHRITNKGFLGVHTDFNTYKSSEHGLLDRRLNVLIYMNPEWKDAYKGDLLLCNKQTILKRISPILNRCVIFTTTDESLHGHPEPLNTMCRNSIAMYYYTKNNNKDTVRHSTIFYENTFK